METLKQLFPEGRPTSICQFCTQKGRNYKHVLFCVFLSIADTIIPRNWYKELHGLYMILEVLMYSLIVQKNVLAFRRIIVWTVS